MASPEQHSPENAQPANRSTRRLEDIVFKALGCVAILLFLWVGCLDFWQHQSVVHLLKSLVVVLGVVALAPTLYFILKGGEVGGIHLGAYSLVENFAFLVPSLVALLMWGWVTVVGSHAWLWEIVGLFYGCALGGMFGGLLYAIFPDIVSGLSVEEAVKKHSMAEILGLGATPLGFLTVMPISLIAGWVGLACVDVWLHAYPLPREVERFAQPALSASDNIGLALSGGGYRAALYHAGVLYALEHLGHRPSHLSTVSGGAIIGGYYARGGTSCAFRHAVVAQHFNLLRDLVDVRNALRLLLPLTLPILETKLWPWHHFSRLDVQANLLDDFLFEGETMVTLASRDDDTPQTPPHLLVNTTDLGSGAAIGFSRHGVLVLGPTAAALVPLALPTALEHGRLARLVAIAGAFPAAFPTTKVVFGATEGTHPLAGEVFALSDGGVFDNSGVLPLQVMHRLSSRAASYAEVLSLQPHNLPQRPLPSQRLLQRIQERMQDEKTREGRDRWRVNLILASDGGHVFQESQGDTMDALHTVVRAVTVSGLHDAKPLAGPSEDDAPVLWLRPHALLDAFQRPKFVPDALLARLVPWVPSAQFSEPSSTASSGFFATLTRLFDRRGTHDEAHGGRSPWTVCPENQAGTPRRLDEFSPTQRDHFRRVVTTDIQQAVQVFEASDTLQDQYTAREADALFRLGMYVVFHHHDAIMRSLTRGAPLPPRSNGS